MLAKTNWQFCRIIPAQIQQDGFVSFPHFEHLKDANDAEVKEYQQYVTELEYRATFRM